MKKSIFLLIVLLLVATTTALGQKLNVDQQNATMLRHFQQQRRLMDSNPGVSATQESLKNLEGLKSFQQQMAKWMAKQQQSNSQFSSLMRSPAEGVQLYRLDSLISLEVYNEDTLPSMKQSFTYDYNRRVTGTEFWEDYEKDAGWTLGERIMLSYNDNWDITSYESDLWDKETGEWTPEFKMLITYNESNNITLMEQYATQEDDEGNYVFAGVMKMEYAYGDDNDWTLMLFYVWDWESNDWVPEMKMETRREHGMEMMFANYQWDRELNIWIGHWKFENELVVSHEMMNTTYYHWNYEKNEWYIQDKTSFTIISFEDAQAVEMLSHGYDYESESLIPYNKSIYYDPVHQDNFYYNNFRKTYNYSWNPQSGEWTNSEHTISTLSEHDLKTLQEHYVWMYIPDSTAYKWIQEWKTEFWYDNQQNLTESLYTRYSYSYLTNLTEISRKSKTLFEYNDQNQNTQRIYQYWNTGDTVWTNNSKYTYTYHSSGQILEEVWYERYNLTAEQWIPSRKFEFDYNWDGEMAMQANYLWIEANSTWQLNRKTEDYIDEKGRTTLSSETNWNYQLEQVIIYFREENQWDAMDRLVLHSYIWSDVHWDGVNYHLFTNGEKETVEYDEHHRQVREYSWYYIGSEFKPEKRMEFFYHEQFPMALILEHQYRWSEATSAWELEKMGELSYNFDVLRTQILLPFGDNEREAYRYFGHLPILLEEFDYDKEEQSWQITVITNLYYIASEFSSTEELEQPYALKVYPNPAGDFIRIQLPASAGNVQLYIYDLQGRGLYESQFKQNMEVDLRDLVPGVYFYRIVTETGTMSGKLLKQ